MVTGKRDRENVLDRLIARWQADGVVIRRGVQEECLSEFEEHNSVVLPWDFKHYFLTVDGLSNDDRDGFLFWPLAFVKSVPAVCREERVPLPTVDQLNQYFVFADYLQWSWAYAIYLADRTVALNPVIMVGTYEPTVVAQSFSAFVELYLTGSDDLYVKAD